jgi:hypothetical protein
MRLIDLPGNIRNNLTEVNPEAEMIATISSRMIISI